jgi:hypothetical protein
LDKIATVYAAVAVVVEVLRITGMLAERAGEADKVTQVHVAVPVPSIRVT